MNWDEVVRRVTPYVVKIETPTGHGTGFLCLSSKESNVYGIATAKHVVSHADDWQQPIRIHHEASQSAALVKEDERGILTDSDRDSAFVIIPQRHFEFPESLIPLFPVKRVLPIGADVGWIGYPSVVGTFSVSFLVVSVRLMSLVMRTSLTEWRSTASAVAQSSIPTVPMAYTLLAL